MLMLIIIASIYVLSPVYDFSEPFIFKGSKFFNPYENVDTACWRKANFQLHTNAWGKLADGSQNTPDNVYLAYKDLGYDVISISDYHSINKYNKDNPAYVPVYEHGINIMKNHQLAIGAREVLWLDYPLLQNIHNKQDIIDRLRFGTEFVGLSHPGLRDAYTLEDMKYLSNYDFIEVLNNLQVSENIWDAALSNGHLAYLLADDDAHNIENLNEYGRCANIINSPSLNKNDILANLKAGKSYGIQISRVDREPVEEKIRLAHILEKLIFAKIENGILKVNFNQAPVSVKFIGQNGKLLKTTSSPDSLFYEFQSGDSYIRTVAEFKSGNKIYLNPIVRYENDKPETLPLPQINNVKTILVRLIGFSILGSLFYFTYRFLFRRNSDDKRE